MKKTQCIWVVITSIFLLSGFKKNIEIQADIKKPFGLFDEPVKVSIAGTTAIRGDKGQRPVKVMIYLSQPATELVAVKYSTEDASAKVGVDYVAANGSITFQKGEVAKWITVFIIGEVAAEADEGAHNVQPPEFIVKITEATGVIIDAARGFIKIIQHISQNPSLFGVAGNGAIYEVIISYTGYTSFHGTAAECGIRPDGVVVLSGYLSGVENVGPHDDILYTGNLEMIIDIDICSARGGDIREDEHQLCGITVNGSGKVYTELEIQYDERGGYIKIENKDGRFIRTVSGNCDDQQKDEEWTMVPNKTIASAFNGTELPMLTNRTLRAGRWVDAGDYGTTVVEVLRKIR